MYMDVAGRIRTPERQTPPEEGPDGGEPLRGGSVEHRLRWRVFRLQRLHIIDQDWSSQCASLFTA